MILFTFPVPAMIYTNLTWCNHNKMACYAGTLFQTYVHCTQSLSGMNHQSFISRHDITQANNSSRTYMKTVISVFIQHACKKSTMRQLSLMLTNLTWCKRFSKFLTID